MKLAPVARKHLEVSIGRLRPRAHTVHQKLTTWTAPGQAQRPLHNVICHKEMHSDILSCILVLIIAHLILPCSRSSYLSDQTNLKELATNYANHSISAIRSCDSQWTTVNSLSLLDPITLMLGGGGPLPSAIEIDLSTHYNVNADTFHLIFLTLPKMAQSHRSLHNFHDPDGRLRRMHVPVRVLTPYTNYSKMPPYAIVPSLHLSSRLPF